MEETKKERDLICGKFRLGNIRCYQTLKSSIIVKLYEFECDISIILILKNGSEEEE